MTNATILLRFSLLAFASMCVAESACSQEAEVQAESEVAEKPTLHKALLGAWVKTSVSGRKLAPVPDEELKFWGLGHFSVTKRNAKTGGIDYHHIGTYTLDGNTYSETVTYAIGLSEGNVGKTFRFKIKIDGDNYSQEGIGNPYSQGWKRVGSTDKPPTR